MKKVFLSLTLVLSSLLMLSFDHAKDIYPDSVTPEMAKVFDRDYVKTVENEALNKHLEKNFLPLFDDVISIRAQQNAIDGYYYMVLGTKNGQKSMVLLKTSQYDVDNNIYTYIDFSNIKVTATSRYCLQGLQDPSFPGICVGAQCKPRTTNCLGLICGISDGMGCIRE